MRRRLLALAAGALLVPLSAADAHQGNPHYESVIRQVTPKVAGLQLDVLGGDDRLQLVNHTGRTVTVYGYQRPPEPYVRILADGTVQVNRNSPAAYLNEDRYQTGVTVPADVTGVGPPRWTTVDKAGRFDWHDHRIHWMAKGVPPQVTDRERRTRIFDWQVPVSVGAARGSIDGRLSWRPLGGGGAPVGAIAALVALLAAGAVAVVVTRRRRGGGGEAW